MKIDKIVNRLRADERQRDVCPGALAYLIVTITFVVVVLSVNLENPSMLTWFFIYPIAQSYCNDIDYRHIFKSSLVALPFVLLVAIFNPITDGRIAFYIGFVPISVGWVKFYSILMRSLLAVQSIVLLMRIVGFVDICRALAVMRCPRFLITQLSMVYRHLLVLVEEASSMQNACVARGWGRRSFPLKMWGCFISQLLLRTIERGNHIHQAMTARAFNGSIIYYDTIKWKIVDTKILILWITIFALLRFVDISQLIAKVV